METQSGIGFNKMFEVKRFRFLTVSARKLPECFSMCGVCNAIRQSWKLYYMCHVADFLLECSCVQLTATSIGLLVCYESSMLPFQPAETNNAFATISFWLAGGVRQWLPPGYCVSCLGIDCQQTSRTQRSSMRNEDYVWCMMLFDLLSSNLSESKKTTINCSAPIYLISKAKNIKIPLRQA